MTRCTVQSDDIFTPQKAFIPNVVVTQEDYDSNVIGYWKQGLGSRSIAARMHKEATPQQIAYIARVIDAYNGDEELDADE